MISKSYFKNTYFKNTYFKNFLCFAFVLIFSLCIKLPIVFAQDKTQLNNYTINGVFDENKKTLKANETIYFNNTYNESLKDIVLHLYPDSYNDSKSKPTIGTSSQKLREEEKGDILITKVLVSRKKVSFTQDNQILKLKLNDILKKGENLKIYIEFTLKLPKGTSRMGYFNDIYSFTNWYPILSIYNSTNNKWDENPYCTVGESNYAESSNYNVTLKVPKDMKVASTGTTKNSTTKNDTKNVVINAHNVRDFVFIMSPKFQVISKNFNNIKVNSFYYNDDNKDLSKKRASFILDTAIDSLKFFTKEFGKYPFSEFDIIETNLSGGAMEYPQLIQMGPYTFNPENVSYAPSSFIPFEIEATVHETAHQWWFSVVGNNEFKESFLDESLTVYSTAYYFEKTHGKYCPSGTIMQFRMYYDPSLSKLSYPINTSVDAFDSWGDYSSTIYSKGPLVFEELREKVGDDKFKKILKTYFEEYKFKNASIKDLLNVIYKICGKDIKNDISKALNSKNYSPSSIILSNEERNKIQKELTKSEFLESSKKFDISLLSISASAIRGEKIYIVKPSNLSKKSSNTVDSFIDELKFFYKDLGCEKNLIIKYDTDISYSEMKSNNLILIGNPWNNSKLNNLNSSFPISLNKNSINMNGINIYNSNVTGHFIYKNPLNKNKCILVFLWSKNCNLDNLINYNPYTTLYSNPENQFNLNIDNKKIYQVDFKIKKIKSSLIFKLLLIFLFLYFKYLFSYLN